MLQVNDEMTGGVGGKCVTVQAHASGCGQLGLNSVILQNHRVIAWFAVFVGVGKERAVAGSWVFRRTWIDMHFTNGRHQQHIEQIGCACTAQMGMTKTHD